MRPRPSTSDPAVEVSMTTRLAEKTESFSGLLGQEPFECASVLEELD